MAGFLNPISSKTKGEREKERARRKKVGEEKRAMVALLVFILATLEIFGRKNCWTQKIHLAITFSKTRLDVQGHLLGTQPPFCGSTQTLVPNKHHVWTAPKSLET